MNIPQDFVSQESRGFKFKIGRYIASSLSGFVAGVIAASIIWFGVLWVTNLYGNLGPNNTSWFGLRNTVCATKAAPLAPAAASTK
ncbi:MAG: hypothetical protein KGJ89_03475 [Patescibacteria group bacterium]|nr:hypothetical protein [Patescibacteria group bacterium]MDE2015393.1 hypothetical protein [Patescibacteria group bacterium]MDE2226992.1 hypothetical protein [Patescibacteria group bacterium]